MFNTSVAQRWNIAAPADVKSRTGLPCRGATLKCAHCQKALCTCEAHEIITVEEPSLPGYNSVYPKISGLDWHEAKEDKEFITGTSGCDLWVVPDHGPPYTILDGHSAGVFMVAAHPADPHLFVTADESGNVLRYNTRSRLLECRTILDFKCYAVAISSMICCSNPSDPCCDESSRYCFQNMCSLRSCDTTGCLQSCTAAHHDNDRASLQ